MSNSARARWFRFAGCWLALAAATSVASGSDLIRYQLAGTLEEGGQFWGTFAIDPLASDQQPLDGLGRFDLVDVAIELAGTSLFAGDATTGSTTEALLTQSEPAARQALSFTLLASDGQSNAFTELVFQPFTADADVAAPLGPFTGGYFDGAGESPIARLTITQVPEPTSALLACGCVMMLAYGTRSRWDAFTWL